jgi:hypothetical protein
VTVAPDRHPVTRRTPCGYRRDAGCAGARAGTRADHHSGSGGPGAVSAEPPRPSDAISSGVQHSTKMHKVARLSSERIYRSRDSGTCSHTVNGDAGQLGEGLGVHGNLARLGDGEMARYKLH